MILCIKLASEGLGDVEHKHVMRELLSDADSTNTLNSSIVVVDSELKGVVVSSGDVEGRMLTELFTIGDSHTMRSQVVGVWGKHRRVNLSLSNQHTQCSIVGGRCQVCK